MKKILTIFAFAALLTGCKDLYGPNPEPQNPVIGKGVTVTVAPAGIKDTGFTAEIIPAEKNVFCSYVLCKESQATDKDPDAVLKCTVAGVKCSLTATTYNAAGEELDSNTADSGKGTFQADKIVLEFGNLEQNTTYQLYAVAASSTGLPGAVVSAAALTTDSRTPSQTAAGTFDTDTTVTVVFSQPVSFVEGSKVEVSVFAEYSYQFQQAQSIDSYELADDDVVVGEDGKTVEINYHPEELPAGAYFTVNYPAGAFVSATGVSAKGCSAAYTYDEKGEKVIAVDGEGKALTVFNGDRVETTTFDFTVPEETEVFDPIPTEWAFGQNNKVAPIAIVDDNLSVDYTYGSDEKSVTFKLAYGSGWDYVLNDEETDIAGIKVVLPELPATPGETISLEIPEGILVDMFGNTSAAASWIAKFMQLDEIGTGLFSEPAFLEISNVEATLFYNPSTDVYRIANCFDEGYNLEFKWNRETNKCEIIGRQDTGWLYSAGVGILVCDAHGYYSKNTWEEIVAAGYKQPYYEDGIFVFPDVAYVLTNGQATKPQFTITYNMGRDITKVQLEGVWTCESVTDYWGDSYGPFDVTIQQAVDQEGVPVEDVYAIANLAPYLATKGVTAHTFGTWDAENSQMVIAFDEASDINAGGTPLTYRGFDNVDPDAAEYYDHIYFSVSALPRTIVNLNAYIIYGGGWYEAYYGGAMKLKYKSELPVGPTNYVELNSAKSVSASPKAKAKVLSSSEGSFLRKGKAAFLSSSSKERKLK